MFRDFIKKFKIFQRVIVIMLIFSWVFSGWPLGLWKIQKAQALTTTKTWSFAADAESWTASLPNPNSTVAQWQSADGSPANGSLEMRILGKNKDNPGRVWEIAGTWEAIFGIPAGSIVTEVGSGTGNSYNYSVSEYNVGAPGNSGPFEFYDNIPTLIDAFSAATAFSGTVTWTTKTGAAISVPAGLQASNNTVRFRITNYLATGNNNNAAVTLRQDQIVLTITYTEVTPADLSWDTGAADFEIWAGATATTDASLTWDNGTLICSTSLTDDNTRQSTCGSINSNQKYRVQAVLKNVGGTAVSMNGAGEPVDHKNVKAHWAGTSPTLDTCGVNDFGADNGGSVSCGVAFNGNDVRLTLTGPESAVIAATTGSEGFMYLITTDTVSLSDSSSYMDATIDSITEDSSRITMGQNRARGIHVRGWVKIRGLVKFR